LKYKLLTVGHFPTLFGSFLYFDISFMIWGMVGALGVYIAQDLGLTATQKGLVTAFPILGGSLLRVPFGIIADRIGSKRTGVMGMMLTFVPLFWGWLFADSLSDFIALGLLLGTAGASFAVALPLASRWYPKEHQGLVMGLVGAGNSGTLISTLLAPRLASIYGWQNVFALYMIPLALTLGAFTVFTKEKNNQEIKKVSEYIQLFRTKDTLLLSFLYSVTFGGFVGLSSYLSIFFHDQYGLNAIDAGVFATLCILAGSFFRPLGGYLADRIGGIRMLLLLLSSASLTTIGVAQLPPLYIALVLLFATMLFLGMGNGSVFQLVPLRFPKQVGLATGLVGAAGGLGGFLLPLTLGTVRDLTGSYGLGLGFFGLGGMLGVALLRTTRAWTWAHAEKVTPPITVPIISEAHVYAVGVYVAGKALNRRYQNWSRGSVIYELSEGRR
jgi:NNP family nitrate/nitrite transporter-like MFS transporter